MSPIRALIVDDEPPACRELRRLLAPYPDVVVVAEAGRLADARAAIVAHAPDVVFLDLRLDRDIGFEVLPAVPRTTAVVFVTAYDEYAVRAFETNALDYLLKPVDPARLALTIARLRTAASTRRTAGDQAPARLPDLAGVNDWLLLRSGEGEEFVRTGSIVCIVAEGDYTRVGTIDGRSRVVHRTLRDWESRLPAEAFERVHRSAMANLRHVLRVERRPRCTAQLVLRGQPALTVSRRAAARLRRLHG